MYIRFLREDYDPATGVLTISALPIRRSITEEFAEELGETSEDIGDSDEPDGILNYVTAKHAHHVNLRKIQLVVGSALLLSIPLFAQGAAFAPNAAAAVFSAGTLTVSHAVYLRAEPRLYGQDRMHLLSPGTTLTVINRPNASWFHVRTPDGQTGYVVSHPYYVEAHYGPTHVTTTAASRGAVPGTAVTGTAATGSAITGATGSPTANPASYSAPTQITTPSTLPTLPLGVHLDPNITPLAPLHATYEQKFQAVLTIAQDKLGTPYIWGHNEDRGQYGFDCSNFTEYVYHHALGYLMSTASRVQATSVGDPVPIGDMQPGDLLIFNNGGHVGIYIGNGQMIQEGGGLGKVGYLRVSPGSYWYNHLTAVKRMF